VPAADGQHVVAEPHGPPAGVDAHLVDVVQRDQVAAVDPHEAGGCPLLFQRRQRHPHQVAAVAGVQPRVVAVRLDETYVAAVDEPGDPAELDRDRLVAGRLLGRRLAQRLQDPADGLGEPFRTTRGGRWNRASTRATSSPSSPGIRMSRKSASTGSPSSALSTSAPDATVRTAPMPG
jgi:hypothetical protein